MMFYIGFFVDGEVLDVVKYGVDGFGLEGMIMVVCFSIVG